MKKTLQMFCSLALLVLFGFFIFSIQNRNVQFKITEERTLVLSLTANNSEEILHPWFDEDSGLTYFFLPSFVQDNSIYCDYISDGTLTVDDKSLSKWERFEWEAQTPYLITLNGQAYEIIFMKSANLPSLFLETESGSMEYINTDKGNEETGSLNLIKASGNVEYQGNLKKVSARGNSTFATEKKAYTFTMNKEYPLCGLDTGKKWNLLALHYEHNKIQSKLIYDMADYMGMEYTPGCTWVDLYCNGNYQGLYLLTEAITVGDGRVEIYDLEKENEKNTNPSNISGGYLLEREVTEHLEPTEVYFTTNICNYNFVLSSPKHPTAKELDYIKNYTQNIENMLTTGDPDYKNYLDLDSFSKQFLIDKLVLNPDAMRSSTFYYKDRNSDILKAGPLWDYDRAMGVSLPNYMLRIGDYPDTMNDWYVPLYEDAEFYSMLTGCYEQLLPYLENLLENQIDIYAEMLASSIAMDMTMWPINSIYTEHDSYVKYLKYFLSNRINFLNELWGISDFEYELPVGTEEMHTIRFFDENGALLETCQVKDGECITSLPTLDTENYQWRYHQDGTFYDPLYPMYENMDIYAEHKFDTPEELVAYKLNKLKAEKSLENYLTLLTDTDFSICIYLPAHSELFDNEEFLKALEAISIYQIPTQLTVAGETGADYFLLVDNGWECIWESVNGETLSELSTTFGSLSYFSSDDGQRHLYIQETENNYLTSAGNETAIQFAVINRLTGSIEDIAAFTMSERINLQ